MVRLIVPKSLTSFLLIAGAASIGHCADPVHVLVGTSGNRDRQKPTITFWATRVIDWNATDGWSCMASAQHSPPTDVSVSRWSLG